MEISKILKNYKKYATEINPKTGVMRHHDIKNCLNYLKSQLEIFIDDIPTEPYIDGNQNHPDYYYLKKTIHNFKDTAKK
ncbi:MAG: hypothetical protein Q8O27_00750 [Enterobacteriaceae bacterium]|nr:hypothetical protein [Enterobacteriaceae bacterium]